MEGSLEFILRKNGNPLTKAAFVEIAHFVFNCEDKASALVEKVLSTCLGDLGGGRNESVGWQLYLEQAASLVFDVYAKNVDFKGILSDVVEMLLQNDNEEVVMKTLSWMNNSKSEYSSTAELRQALRRLICQNDWDGVCALALRVIPGVFGDDEQGFSLTECIRGYQGNQVMPVREGWIAVAGFAARTVFPLQFDADSRNTKTVRSIKKCCRRTSKCFLLPVSRHNPNLLDSQPYDPSKHSPQSSISRSKTPRLPQRSFPPSSPSFSSSQTTTPPFDGSRLKLRPRSLVST
jgi:hypothetical protein